MDNGQQQAHAASGSLGNSPGGDRPFFYPSRSHSEALARMQFLVDQSRRMGLILGESGTGKSTLLDIFAEQLHEQLVHVARVDLIGLDRHAVLWKIAADWGLNPGRRASTFDLWRAVNDRVIETRLLMRNCAVLLDNVDQASEDLQRAILQLAGCDPVADCRLTILLTSRGLSQRRLNIRLLDQVSLRMDLVAWDEEETWGYLTELLSREGRAASAFDLPAVRRLHELSGGVPRQVCQLTSLALLAGEGQSLPDVQPETVDAVYRELAVAGSLAGQLSKRGERDTSLSPT